MLNKCLFIGNTTREIELRYLPSGSAVAKTGLAVNEQWKDKTTGETKSETMFIDIVIFGKSAEIANQYIAKGKKILVEGKLKLEQWADQSGQKRSKHILSVESFQFLDSKAKEGNEPKIDTDREPDIRIGGRSEIDISDDEIPFSRG